MSGKPDKTGSTLQKWVGEKSEKVRNMHKLALGQRLAAQFSSWMESHSNHGCWLGFVLLSSLYMVSRLIYLDSDVPIWLASYYSPIDEFYYTASAFDVVEGGGEGFGAAYLNLLQQLLTSASLYLFGDNYYGLRLPSVLAGYFVLTPLYWLIAKRFGFVAAFCLGLALIVEFSFNLATRVAEPTIFRMAAACLLMWAFVMWAPSASRKQAILLGFAAGGAWCFVYPTNAFVVLAGLIVLCSLSSERFRIGLQYCAGVALALLVYVAVLLLIDFDWGRNIGVLHAVSGRVAHSNSIWGWMQMLWYNIDRMQHANFFIRVPYFKYATIGAVLLFVPLLVKFRDLLKASDYVVLIFILSFVAQTAFVNDYPQRKLVMLLPLLLYFCAMSYLLVLPRIMPRWAGYGVGLLVFALVIGPYYSVTKTKVYANPRYSYKEDMQKLQFLNGKRVIGGWGYGFRLYNDYRPSLNKYLEIYGNEEKYYKQIQEAVLDGGGYVIDYDNPVTTDQLKGIGFYKYRLVHKSLDRSYPDVYLFRHEHS